MITTVVLARLLMPEDFGLFALGLVMLNLFDYVRDFGVTAALVQHRDSLSRLAPTGLTMSLLFGVVVTVAALLLAPTISELMGHPELTGIVRVLAAALLISSFNSLPQATLRRSLEFRRRLVPEVGGALVKVVVAIGCALVEQGVWSLVWAQLTGSLVTTCLYWAVARPSFRMGLDRSVVVSLLRFGMPVTALTFVAFLEYSLATTMIGRRLGSEAAGYYSLGYRLADITILGLCAVIGEVLFSALARMQDDRPRLVNGYLATVSVVVTVTFPVSLGIALLAPDIVALLYGARYSAAAAPLTWVAISAAVHSATFHSGEVYKAIGRPALLTYLSATMLVVEVPAVWLTAGQSIVAVALALVAVELVNLIARVALVKRVLGPSARQQLMIYAGPGTAALVMASAVWGAGHLLPGGPTAIRVGMLVLVGAIVYLGCLRLVAPVATKTLLDALRTMIGRENRPSSANEMRPLAD